jgi:hypothetical protein
MKGSGELRGVRAAAFAAAFALAGVVFVLYPAIRPFSSEVGMDGARAFASSSWIVAHSLGILGFVFVALGALGLHARLRETPAAGRTADVRGLLLAGARACRSTDRARIAGPGGELTGRPEWTALRFARRRRRRLALPGSRGL